MTKITALLAVAVLGLAACGSSSNDNSSSSSGSSPSASAGGGYGSGASKTTKTTKNTTASTGGSGVKLALVDNAFQPKAITGKAGSTVKVQLSNTGQNEHNFTIDSQKVKKDLEAGKTATVSVKIPSSGSVQFYCEYHKGLGMVGTVKAS
jgi:plastocyanin